MTGKTHKAGGMLGSVVGFALLKKCGMIPSDVNDCLAWVAMYPFCMWGSVASDLDHHWEVCPVKDLPSRMVNICLHAGKPVKKALEKSGRKKSLLYGIANFFTASHRSWQTHSDLTLVSMLYLLYMVMSGSFACFNTIETTLLSLILTGICLGVSIHFILDMLTPEGIWLMGVVLINKLFKLHLPDHLHFVPHMKVFATGNKWEEFVYKFLSISTVVVVILILVSYLPIEVSF